MSNSFIATQDTVRLSEVFSRPNIALVQEYVRQIRRILATKDVALLVARKGICFFYALEANGFFDDLRNEQGKYHCEVFSTRVLSYAHSTVCGSIAVIDDVMVSGEAMRRAMRGVEGRYESIEYLVGGACASLLQTGVTPCDDGLLESVHPIRQLKRLEVLELAREITQYIQASGISNHIDHPVLKLRMKSGLVLEDALAGLHAVDVATGTQHHYRISSYTVTLEPSEILSQTFFDIVNNREGLVIKCRFLMRQNTGDFECIPIVILPELSSDTIDRLYSLIISTSDKELCSNVNQDEELRNKLRITQYALSLHVGREICNTLAGTELVRGGKVARLDGARVKSAFGADISELLHSHIFVNISPSATGLHSEYVTPQVIRREVGRIRTWALTDTEVAGRKGSADANLSGTDIARFVAMSRPEGLNETEWTKASTLLTSLCLGSMIDRGIFVPYSRIKRTSDTRRVVRTYHGGEIERMTDELIAQFALFMLYMQRTAKEESFHVDVVNALGVIFARNAALDNRTQMPEPDDPIAYSFDSDMWGLRAGMSSDSRGKSLSTVLELRTYMQSTENKRMSVALEEDELLDLIVGSDANMVDRRKSRTYSWPLAEALGSQWRGRNDECNFLNSLRKIIVGRSYRYAFGILRNNVDAIGAILKDGFRFRSKKELAEALTSAVEKLRYRDGIETFANSLYEGINDADPDSLSRTTAICKNLERLLDDPYSNADDNRSSVSVLYQEMTELILKLRQHVPGYMDENRHTERSQKPLALNLNVTERLMLADDFEKCSASIASLFGGSDLTSVTESDVKNTMEDELRARQNSRVLAVHENSFTYCRRDIIAIGLQDCYAAQSYPKCHFVMHDHTGGVRWGSELSGSSQMRGVHTAILFLSQDACPSIIDGSAQLVEMSAEQGRLLNGHVKAERLVRAVNTFIKENVSSGTRILAICQPEGFACGFDDALSEIQSLRDKQSRYNSSGLDLRDTINRCVRECIDNRFDLAEGIDGGVISAIEKALRNGTIAQKKNEIVKSIREHLVSCWTRDIWHLGNYVESCVGSQDLCIPGMEFFFCRIEG